MLAHIIGYRLSNSFARSAAAHNAQARPAQPSVASVTRKGDRPLEGKETVQAPRQRVSER